MDDPILTIEERAAINNGRWFSSLSPSLRHDILRCAFVKRYKDSELICARGDAAEAWSAVARGAVRVSSTSITGKQVTLTYVEPGVWFGDVAMFDGERRTHRCRVRIVALINHREAARRRRHGELLAPLIDDVLHGLAALGQTAVEPLLKLYEELGTHLGNN